MNAGALKVCPKITNSHIYPSNCEKMRVKLATQVFSRSMASGIEFYRNHGVRSLGGSEATQEFTLFRNNLFDALNRRFPREGVTKDGFDLGILSQGLEWLDNWEKELPNGNIIKEMFLTKSTAEGLRITLRSTKELCEVLLHEHKFRYILTNKMNQDPIERFFGKIRLAESQNDHPFMPTFLQLYNTMCIYSLLKPPKFGNCCVVDEKPLLDSSDFRALIEQGSASNTSPGFVDQLKEKLDKLILVEDWECKDIISANESNTAHVVDCILYYVVGFLSRKLMKITSCSRCWSAFTVPENSSVEASLTITRRAEVDCCTLT